MILRRWPALLAGIAMTLAVLAVPSPALAVDDPPDGSRSGLGWTYVALVGVAIIVAFLLFHRGRRRK